MQALSATLLGAQAFASIQQARTINKGAGIQVQEIQRQRKREEDSLQARRIERKRALLQALGDEDYKAGKGGVFSSGGVGRVKDIYTKRQAADDQEDELNTANRIKGLSAQQRLIRARARSDSLAAIVSGATAIGKGL